MNNNKNIELAKRTIYKSVFIVNLILYIYLITSLINIKFQQEQINSIILIVSFFFISFYYLFKILNKDDVIQSIRLTLRKIDNIIANILERNQSKLIEVLGKTILYIVYILSAIVLFQLLSTFIIEI